MKVHAAGQQIPTNNLWLPEKKEKEEKKAKARRGAIQNLMQSIQTTFVKRAIKAIFNVRQTINLHV